MEKLNLNYDELVNFYTKYDWKSLNFLELLLTNVKKYDTQLSEEICKKALQNQYTILLYEGGSEYSKTNELSEIIDSVDLLDKKEAIYLEKIIVDSMNNISELLKETIEPDIKEILIRINNKLNDSNELSERELKKFFNKYNVLELNKMNLIFEYAKENNVEEAIKIKEEVMKEKLKGNKFYPKKFSLLNIVNKNHLLNNKELNYLFSLVEDASFYLSYIREQAEMYENIDESEYPIDIMNELEVVLYNELENRKYKVKKRN